MGEGILASHVGFLILGTGRCYLEIGRERERSWSMKMALLTEAIFEDDVSFSVATTPRTLLQHVSLTSTIKILAMFR